MFLRGTIRKKNGKEHRYWSIVENKRVAGGKVRQRHVLYLGEINASQERAWRKSIEVLDEQADRRRTLALFPEDRCDGLLRIPPLSGCDCRNCAYTAPGNGEPAGWRLNCGKSCNWESSGAGGSLLAARVRVGTMFSSSW